MAAKDANSAPTALHITLAIGFSASLMLLAMAKIGWPPVVIVGGSSLVGLVMWLRTWRYGPISPAVVLPPFLLTVAALEAHMFEEYVTGFGPAMSRLFAVSWSEFSFLVIFAFAGPVVYALTALGLFWRKPLAGFVAWFIFIGPGVAEFSHFIFPLLAPAIEPTNPGSHLATCDARRSHRRHAQLLDRSNRAILLSRPIYGRSA